MKKPKALSVIVLFFLTSYFCQAQNLVPNPSFENYTDAFCGILIPTDFNQIMIDWVNPTWAAPQLFFTNIADSCHNLQPHNQYTGPIGIKGSQLPRTGNVMAGIHAYTIPGFNQRAYLQVELNSPLIVGNSYVIEFFVSLADSIEYAVDKVGAYLSTNPISSANYTYMDYTPQVISDGFMDNSDNWESISDTIIALEAYTYLTIGNFYNDVSTDTQPNPLSSGGVGAYGSFYFIDDVRIEEITPVGIGNAEDESFLIYPTLISDVLNLKIPFKSSIEIYNSIGQLVYSQPAERGFNTINTSAFSGGVYIISVRDGERVLTRRIVK